MSEKCQMGTCGRILCSIHDVNLAMVLRSGQSFRWAQLESGEWAGPLGRRLWVLRQDKTGIDFRVLSSSDGPALDEADAETLLADYFQLKVDLAKLYTAWSAGDPTFGTAGHRLPGVRVLRQEPVENLFCFICSSNNNIQRITSMVESLCRHYGEPIVSHAGRAYHSFPSVSRLAATGVEAHLRRLGFGYRARYVAEAAGQVEARGGEPWLRALRSRPYDQCCAQLRTLCGVGAKVADCVCLMSLDQPSAVPVDTHVHQLAARHYLPHLRLVKSLTAGAYRQVADHFRRLFGDHAGWAQAVLFCGDLNTFKESDNAAVGANGVSNFIKKEASSSGAKRPVAKSRGIPTEKPMEGIPRRRSFVPLET